MVLYSTRTKIESRVALLLLVMLLQAPFSSSFFINVHKKTQIAAARAHIDIRNQHDFFKNQRNSIKHKPTKFAKRDDDLVENIISPFDNIIEFLSTPIEQISLPIIYPLAALAFNVLFNTTSAILFDLLFCLFYVIVQEIKSMEEDDDENNLAPSPILDVVSFLSASTTALIISPKGFETRDLNLANGSAIIFLPIFMLVLFGIVVSMRREQLIPDDHPYEDENSDASKRLLELFDEKLDGKP